MREKRQAKEETGTRSEGDPAHGRKSMTTPACLAAALQLPLSQVVGRRTDRLLLPTCAHPTCLHSPCGE